MPLRHPIRKETFSDAKRLSLTQRHPLSRKETLSHTKRLCHTQRDSLTARTLLFSRRGTCVNVAYIYANFSASYIYVILFCRRITGYTNSTHVNPSHCTWDVWKRACASLRGNCWELCMYSCIHFCCGSCVCMHTMRHRTASRLLCVLCVCIYSVCTRSCVSLCAIGVFVCMPEHTCN